MASESDASQQADALQSDAPSTDAHELSTECELRRGDDHFASDPRFKSLFSSYSRAPTHGKFEYFPANRQILPKLWREPTPPDEGVQEGALRLTRESSKYGFVRHLLFSTLVAEGMRLQDLVNAHGVVTAQEDLDLKRPFKEALAALTDELRLVRVEATAVDFARIWFMRRDRRIVELEQLSSSERQAVLFATTYCRQGLSNSVILIDIPELFIHPENHVRFLDGLLSLGDNNQVIAATTSDRVLEGFDAAGVVELPEP